MDENSTCRGFRNAQVCTWPNSTLSPLVPPDDPVIDGGPEVLLNAGDSYNLSCVSRGAKPPSMVEWLKDGLPVEGAVSTTVSLQKRSEAHLPPL